MLNNNPHLRRVMRKKKNPKHFNFWNPNNTIRNFTILKAARFPKTVKSLK